MRFSPLQRFILLQSFTSRRPRYPRQDFRLFYADLPKPPKPADQQNSITKSLERLIDRGLLVGYGRRTPEKWFIDEVRLTPTGRAQAKKLLGEQQRLPLRLNKR